jgi:hypothetical protein
MDWRAILGIVLAWTLGVIVTLVKFGSNVSTRQAVADEKIKSLQLEIAEQKDSIGMTRKDLEDAIKSVLENGGVRTEMKKNNDILIRLERKVEVYTGTQNQINIRLEQNIDKANETCANNARSISELTGNVARMSGIIEGNHNAR